MNNTQEKIVFGSLENFSDFVDISSYSSVLIVSGDNKYEAGAAATLYKSISDAGKTCVNTMSIPSSESAKTNTILQIL